MGTGLEDLIPLFASEARERLDQLTTLVDEVEHDTDIAAQAKRQLHALKGAANMMQLTDIASLCHEAEALLDPVAPGAADRMVGLLDEVAAELARVTGDQVESTETAPEPAMAPATAGDSTGARTGPSRVSLEAPVLDELADRSALLRLASLKTGGLADRVFALARAAEQGSNEPCPEEVLATLATALGQVAGELDGNQRGLHRLARQQLEQLLQLQLQSVRPFLQGLARHARELARSLGRQVRVRVSAGDTRLDRRIVAALRESLLHLVRNAVDHGIEAPQERQGAGKTPQGWIDITARTEGHRVRIRVADDGRGIPEEAVRRRAVERGLLSPEQACLVAAEELTPLLCLPGFTTRDEPSQVSGRGVGLDAVAAAVRGVGGDLWIESEAGKGTTVAVDVPLARRGERVLVLEVGRCRVALPSLVVRGFGAAAEPPEVGAEVDLAAVLGERAGPSTVRVESLIGGAERTLLVNGVLGEEEVAVRPVPGVVGQGSLYDGLALLASGRPVPVLSPQALLDPDLGQPEDLAPSAHGGLVRVLLVEDSTVTREMLRRLLEDAGFEVVAAASGERALERLAERTFDCVVTDIQMPGLDGLELTRRIRSSAGHAQLPIVVVSNLDRPQDRLDGLDAGADAYLSKRGLDAHHLVKVVRRAGGGS
jgi:chemotaxis protein histidine kinase CheA